MTTRVATLYFMPISPRRPLYSGVFDLPAVPKGAKPEFLTINDHVQLEQRPHVLGGGKTPVQIRSIDIANCIVKEYSRNGLGMTGDCGPAIWVVRDAVPMLNLDGTPVLDAEKRAQFRPATEEEKAQMWAEDLAEQTARQDRWCQWLISQGNILDADPEKKMQVWITDTMRAGAKYADVEVPWQKGNVARAVDRKECPFCFKSVESRWVKCQHCNEVLDREKYAALTAKPPIAPPVKNPKEQQPAA